MIKVPTFKINSTDNNEINLQDYVGSNIVLYFYPKDDYAACIAEAEDFRDNLSEFWALNCHVFGVSRDSIESHRNFKEKYNLPFELLSDRDEKLCKHFNVIREKQWHDITYDSIVRSTFLINAKGEVVKEWRDVKVETRVTNVLKELRKLAAQHSNSIVHQTFYMPQVNNINASLSLITSSPRG